MNTDKHIWDSDQSEIINKNIDERIIVNAGPGMGKTAIASARVVSLINSGSYAGNIHLLSFTKTAVKEIRDRILSDLDTRNDIKNFKISTIDSYAWNIRYQTSESEFKELKIGYEESIEDTIKKTFSKEEDGRIIREDFSTIEHFMVDEAQDLTGVRKKLILRLIQLLDKNCGITIFDDPAQAIYGFTRNEEFINKTEIQNNDQKYFVNSLSEEFVEFQTEYLKKIYRTSEKKLIRMAHSVREQILSFDYKENISDEQFDKIHNEIRSGGTIIENNIIKNVKQHPSALHLYRSRFDVLLDSQNLLENNIKHFLRMGAIPDYLNPIIAILFSNYSSNTMTKETFYSKLKPIKESSYLNLQNEWKLLFSLFSFDENQLDINKIKKVLSYTKPIELCLKDIDSNYSTLGTIHGSKGRESSKCILNIPMKYRIHKRTDFKEEARVLFVGASRAKNNLFIKEKQNLPSYVRYLFPPKGNGRVYQTITKSSVTTGRVEIGRQGDYDPLSVVSKHLFENVEQCLSHQNIYKQAINYAPIKVVSKVEKIDGKYYDVIRTADEGSTFLGSFSKYLNSDLFTIGKEVFKTFQGMMGGPQTKHIAIENIYLTGFQSYVLSEEEPRREELFDSFKETRTWLVPIIRGFGTIEFKVYGGGYKDSIRGMYGKKRRF